MRRFTRQPKTDTPLTQTINADTETGNNMKKLARKLRKTSEQFYADEAAEVTAKTKNAAQQALTNAINRAIANGAPVYVNQPVTPVTPVKTFVVTRTTVETFEARGSNVNDAGILGKPINTKVTCAVAEKLATPEYRVVVTEDSEYQLGNGETLEDVESAGGSCGYTVERRDTVDGEWEHVDSCWGFLGNDRSYMLSQAAESIPEGVRALFVANDRFEDQYGRTVTGTMKASK